MNKVSLSEKFALIREHWRPKVVAQLNGQEFKLVKFKGTFPWHHHEKEDELFLVWRGQMTIEFRDRRVTLQAGELCVVPHGVEHRTMADAEAEVLVVEPAETRNTGNPPPEAVVDRQGQVFFQDGAARTIWKIDSHGKASAHHDKLGGHWMTLDTKGRFTRSDLKLVERISPTGFSPAMMVADGGAHSPTQSVTV